MTPAAGAGYNLPILPRFSPIVRALLTLVALVPILMPPGMCPCQVVFGAHHDDPPLTPPGEEKPAGPTGCPCDHHPDCLLLDGLLHRVTVPAGTVGPEAVAPDALPVALTALPEPDDTGRRPPPGRAAPPTKLFLAHRALLI